MAKKKRTMQFQTVGTAMALIISVSALVVSIYEANLLKAQQKALIWPYLSVEPSYSGDGFSFVSTNNGTGPAIIKSMEIRRNGLPVKNYDELLDLIKPDREIGYDYIKMKSLNNTVMKPGERRVIFNMPWTDETREMVKNFGDITVVVQYCSVLDECWLYKSETNEHVEGELKADLEFEN
ncbi:MAG: hypothetical protein NXI20_11840 [bacterium]|nr:hypothetical protein [bacterium]